MRWLIALALVTACQKEPRAAAPSNTTDGRDAPGATRPVDAAPDACVEECVKANQMKATSIENIEAECRAECAAKTTP
jgi:hypothetical protein